MCGHVNPTPLQCARSMALSATVWGFNVSDLYSVILEISAVVNNLQLKETAKIKNLKI